MRICIDNWFYLLLPVVVIGFVPDNYTVTEGVDGFVNLTVELLDGELGRDVVVEVDIVPGGTATSKSYHIHI